MWTMTEIEEIKAAENRIFAELIEMMGIGSWPAREKLRCFSPTAKHWRDVIFQQISRGVPEQVIVDYLRKKNVIMKSFRGVPVWNVFRDLERMPFGKIDTAHDDIKRQAQRRRVAAEAEEKPQWTELDRLCGALMRGGRSAFAQAVRGLANGLPAEAEARAAEIGRRLPGLMEIYGPARAKGTGGSDLLDRVRRVLMEYRR